MPLQPVTTTESALANQIAQRFVNQVGQLATQIATIRAKGIPATEAVAPRVADGREIPGRPAMPAVSPEAIDAALGKDNCALFDALKVAITGE